jgi:hypothetical protein
LALSDIQPGLQGIGWIFVGGIHSLFEHEISLSVRGIGRENFPRIDVSRAQRYRLGLAQVAGAAMTDCWISR